jgi:hypothetical protein
MTQYAVSVCIIRYQPESWIVMSKIFQNKNIFYFDNLNECLSFSLYDFCANPNSTLVTEQIMQFG